jgi:lipopolysaccharide export system permease protein
VRVPLALAVVVGAVGVWLALEVEPAGMRAATGAMNEILKRNLSNDVRPGVFYEQIPGYTLYAEAARAGDWRHVLIFDSTKEGAQVLALSQRGKLQPAEGGDLQLALQDGELHRDTSDRASYAAVDFERARLVLGLGRALSDRNSLSRPSREQGYAELQAAIAAAYAQHTPQGDEGARRLQGYLHRKIASAVAVLAFALLGVPLAASPRVGRSFGIGATFLLMVLHYMLLRSGEVMAQRGDLPAWFSLQLPNLVLGGIGVVLLGVLAWRGTGAVR